MSTEVRASPFRLAFGAAGVFVVGMLWAWPLAYLGAVFAALLLQAPAAVKPKAGIGLVVISIALMTLSLLLFRFLLPYPALFMTMVLCCVALFLHLAAKGAPAILVILGLLASLLVPFLQLESEDVAIKVATWVSANLAIGLAASWIAFALFPSPDAAPPTPQTQRDPAHVRRSTIRMLLVALPFTAAFFLIGGGAALTLIYVSILAQQLASAGSDSPKIALGLLAANVLGGAAALIAYELVVIAPNVIVMALATLILACAFSLAVASNSKLAPLAGSAMIAALVIFGSTMAPFGDDAHVKMMDRIGEIALAVIYTLAIFAIVDAVLPKTDDALS